jgi:DNA-binding transcriptional LysR family regulator
MDLRQLEFLVAVADAGAIREAGRRLHTAQPAISQSIRQLEAELGTELLLRSPKGISMTEAGRDLVDRSRKILSEVAEAKQAIQSSSAGHLLLRVGLVSGLLAGGELTAPLIENFRARHPGVQVELTNISFFQDTPLHDGTVDVAIVRTPVNCKDLDVIPIASEPLELLVGTQDDLAQESLVDLEDLRDVPMVPLVAPDDWCRFWQLRNYGQTVNHGIPPAATVDEIQNAVGTHHAAIGAARSLFAIRFNPLITPVQAMGLPRSWICVAMRQGDRRPLVRSFIDEAALTAEKMVNLIPGGQLPGSAN